MVTAVPKIKVSAIIPSEHALEKLVNELIEITVDRHQISIQGSPEQMMKAFGQSYIEPEIIQHSVNAPKQEPFMMDDFGWVLAYSFAIPLIVGVIVGVFFIGNLFSIKDNFLYGVLGGIVGGLVGIALYRVIKLYHDRKHSQQETKGGFVIWIQVDSLSQKEDVIAILNKYNAVHIE